MAGADQPQLLGAEEHEDERAPRAARGGEGAGQADDDGRAGRVVVGAGVGRAARRAEMVPVRAEHDRLPGERGLRAGQHADDVCRPDVRGRQVDDEARRRRIRGGAKRGGGGAREAAGGDVHGRRGRVECGQRIGDEKHGRRAALAREDQRLEPGATRGRDDDLAPHVSAPLVVDERERARDLAGARAAVRRPVHAGRERAAADLQRAARAQTPARRDPERL